MFEEQKKSSITIRFLLFSGSWENEGNFWALETEKTILLFAIGQNSSFLSTEVLEWSYLEKNSKKIQAIFLNNLTPKNCSLLMKIYQEIELKVPIYGSNHSQLILDYLFAESNQIRKNFVSIELNKIWQVAEFSFFAWPLNGYILGNLAMMINYEDYTFYYLEDFSFNNLSNNNLLFFPDFSQQIKESFPHRRKNIFLITSCQNLQRKNNNSLFLETRLFSAKNKNYFFLLYDFDWLHIFELLELALKQKKKIKILEPNFLLLIKKILVNHPLKESLITTNEKKEDTIYLLVGSPENLEKRLITTLEKEFSPQKNFTFVAGISSFNGGEGRTARIIDYLYSKSDEVISFTHGSSFSLGTNLYDLKLLLNIIKPQTIITLQNSYKHSNYLEYLEREKIFRYPNQSFLEITNKKFYPLKVKREKIDTEKLLLLQRENLFYSGFLMVFLISEWKNGAWQLKKLKLESLVISSSVNLLKLEEKIKHWWEKKIATNLSNKKENKDLKRDLERRLTGLLSKYLSFEYDIEFREPVLLLFLKR